MTVVVNYRNAVNTSFELKPPIRILECRKSLGDLSKRNFQFDGDRGCRQGIVNIVFTRYRKIDLAEHVGSFPNRKGRTKRFVVSNIVARDIGLCSHSVGDAAAFDVRNYQLNIRIVKTYDRRAIKRNLGY